jgi:lytic murein transglycosylase
MEHMKKTTRTSASPRAWFAPAMLTVLALAACASAPPSERSTAAPAEPKADTTSAPSNAVEHQQKFARWVAEFSLAAGAAGISEATLQTAFSNVQFLPRVIDSDRSQPEFTRAVWAYLDSAVAETRVAGGQDKLLQLRPQADALVARYGVPLEVLVAIWGVESNFGSNVGDIPTIDALATLGFEGRREPWARGQLIDALKILQNGDIDRAQMIGSWAGAMGQTQFLPSVYLAHAVDADGDGRRDIWRSIPDVMASTANFLAHSGWQSGQPWGVELRLPSGFNTARADDEIRQPSKQWADEGVQAMDGAPLPELPDSAILLPAGARGPAFLIGPNFRTILRYNNSTSYALAVNLLAQRLAGGSGVTAAWPRDLQMLSHSQLIALQTALNAGGFESGTPDGMMGPATRRAIRQYQSSASLPVDGYPTLDLLQRLQ